MNKVTTGVVCSLALVWGVAGSAQAVPCDDAAPYTDGIFTKVSDAEGFTAGDKAWSQCYNGTTSNDSADAMNDASVFGYTNWIQIDKTNDNSATGPNFADSGLTITGAGDIEGAWEFDASLWSSYDSLTIVLKNGPTDDNVKWSAYMIDPVGLSEGWWIYGVDANTFKPKQLSHLSLYGIEGGGVDVPEPPMLGLLALGLIGFGTLGRKRRQ